MKEETIETEYKSNSAIEKVYLELKSYPTLPYSVSLLCSRLNITIREAGNACKKLVEDGNAEVTIPGVFIYKEKSTK